MSNPFIAPGSLLIERERQRREKFKLGVYAILGIFALSLIGMLIQGCKHQDTFADNDNDNAASGSAGAEAHTPPPFVPTTPAGAEPSASAAAASAPSTPSVPPEQPAAPSVPIERPAVASAQPAAPAAAPASDRVYVVKHGDSLFSIAHTHGTTVNALRAANGLKKDSLSLGQKLNLPAAKVTLASASRH
jgi:LysM repeat protein